MTLLSWVAWFTKSSLSIFLIFSSVLAPTDDSGSYLTGKLIWKDTTAATCLTVICCFLVLAGAYCFRLSHFCHLPRLINRIGVVKRRWNESLKDLLYLFTCARQETSWWPRGGILTTRWHSCNFLCLFLFIIWVAIHIFDETFSPATLLFIAAENWYFSVTGRGRWKSTAFNIFFGLMRDFEGALLRVVELHMSDLVLHVEHLPMNELIFML